MFRGRARALAFVGMLGLVVLVGAVTAGSAGATVVFSEVGQIPASGLGSFGRLFPGSVAVDDANGHILVAESNTGVVHDFSSLSDETPLAWEGTTTPAKSFGGGRIAVAADNASGDVYVLDTTDGVVDKFTAAGTLIAGFGDSTPTQNGQLAGVAATPNGAFASPLGIAVDQATHNLYVIDSGHEIVDEFSATGSFITSFSGANTSIGSFSPEYADGIAIDDLNNHIFISDSVGPVVTFDFASPADPAPVTWDGSAGVNPPGTPSGSFGGGYTAVAADNSSGRVYIMDSADNVVDAFSAEGAYEGQITGVESAPNGGLAVDQATGDVYLSDSAEGVVKVFAPSVVPDVATSAPENITENSATLTGTVNPDGEGAVTCQFVWGTTKAFGKVVPCSAAVPNGNAAVAVHADLPGLQPDTTYCYRLQATDKNGTNPGAEGDDHCFRTTGAGIAGESVTDVTSEAATFRAEIDPNGAPTEYFFEYGTDPSYGSSIPVPHAPLGEGTGFVSVAQRASGLTANTAYHYRVVALSELKPGAVARFEGADHTFSTIPSSTAFALLDEREWELVSPPDKEGAQLIPIGEEGVIQAAANGTAVTYLANAPTESKAAGGSNYAQILSTRSSTDWSSLDLATPHTGATGIAVGTGQEYQFFTTDLSKSIVQPLGAFLPLALSASAKTPYLRDTYNGATTCTSECFRPLVTGCPQAGEPCAPQVEAIADVPAGTEIQSETSPGCSVAGPCEPLFVGSSADGNAVVVESFLPLTSGPSGKSLYRWSGGTLGLIGTISEGGPAAFHAISADGSRVTFSGAAEGKEGLLLRDLAAGKTLQLDEGCSGCESGGGRFMFASADGSRILFTDTRDLTANAGAAAESADLYECHVVIAEGEPSCQLTDLTPKEAGRGSDILGVLGASSDGSWVYYSAGGTNPAEPQIYVAHAGGSHVIATVTAIDSPDWTERLTHHTARVSSNGEWLAFMSRNKITGYDNRDALSSEPDEEVFLYGAHADKNICASCAPSGALSTGREYQRTTSGNGHLVGGDRIWPNEQWIAGNIPGWTPYRTGDDLYQSRYLSNSGRLFFNSSNALVPQDINEEEDVYEYEPAMTGTCSSSLSSFHDPSGGCVNLISSGKSATESAFLDASESGNDVFFLTTERLSSKDSDGRLDVYDAHSCTSSPCLPTSSSPPAPCQATDACRPTREAPSELIEPPASIFSTGTDGNLAPLAPVKVAPLTRAQKLTRGLKQCRKLHSNAKKRRTCEQRVRKQYGPKRTSKRAKHATKQSKKGRR